MDGECASEIPKSYDPKEPNIKRCNTVLCDVSNHTLPFLSFYKNSHKSKSETQLAPPLGSQFSLGFSLRSPVMQELRRYPNDVVRLDLTLPSSTSMTTNLSIDGEESTETKIQRLISEHPVIIFSRSSCCMCHVMKKLLANIGVHPTVIELDDHEISALPLSHHDNADSPRNPSAPAVFIGGTCVGGLDSLFALHLSGHLVPKLVEVGALGEEEIGNDATVEC